MVNEKPGGRSEPRVTASTCSMLSPEGERIARLFEDAPSIVAFLRGPTHIYEWVNKAHRRMTGGRDVIGKTIHDSMPELARQGPVDLLDDAYSSGQAKRVSEVKAFVLEANGEVRPGYFDVLCQPITDKDGAVVGLLLEGAEVTERVTSRRALEAREEHLRLAIDAGRMVICATDLDAGLVESDSGLNALLGLPPEAKPSLAELRARFLPGECDRVLDLIAAARARGEPFFEAEVFFRRGESQAVHCCLVRGATSSSDTEAGPRQFYVLMDITGRKADEERLHLLAREVDHRANNLLATVQSLVTLTRADDVASFRETLLGRVTALAQAHRLLAESRWIGASLRRVVDEETRAMAAGDRAEVAGPDANLAPAVAQGVAVALHELAANALKHGAWSTPEGRVSLTWAPPDADRMVTMTWQETGAPRAQPPACSGFGMALLKRALAGAIGGSVELSWRSEGLCCRLHIPVCDQRDDPAATH